MQPYSPEQFNEVSRMIKETAQGGDSSVWRLDSEAGKIAKELADKDAFDYVGHHWVLSDRAWTDWLFSGAPEKYMS